MNPNVHLEQSYLSLPPILYSKIQTKNGGNNTIYILNEDVANQLDINMNFLNSTQGIQFLSGASKDMIPFSQAYCGHQYGHFTMLGDGRAMMLGERNTIKGRYDIQLKGSGRTPYSRSGDGKATLKSMLKEYIISEVIHHLNIPTSRSLAVLQTNEIVEREQANQGAILVRVAQSHIRVGTFEFASAIQNIDVLKKLADYTIDRHYPLISHQPEKYLMLFREVIDKQARLVAKWQSVGFVHGVLNTDNVTISGETIDYGPCAFLDAYDPSISFSSIDRNGRYSYEKQPYITSWNLSKLGEALLPLIDVDRAVAIDKLNTELSTFESKYSTYHLQEMARKIGITNPSSDDKILIDELLNLMNSSHADFTNTFYNLTTGNYDKNPFSMIEWTLWFEKWQKRLLKQGPIEQAITLMKQSNPVLIPRNQIIEEALIQAAFEQDNAMFLDVLKHLQDPFNYEIERPDEYLEAPQSSTPFVTYCGT